MSIRPADSVNCALEQMRRTPDRASGRAEDPPEGARCAEGGGDCAVCDEGRSFREDPPPEESEESEEAAEGAEGGAAEEADEARCAESPPPVSLPHAVTVASAPTSSAHKTGGRSERDRDVVVRRAEPFR
ncbi:hypothetical protein [Streptomyces malaysiensis]|uniref:Uncharacterized protein n=1 Tax=Streptomyces malaysiensis TaxID=92644 RepID=A0A2J7YT57_STRMQ|nr:hypothetical protein [Streptomyces malaysiensis]PNG91201.1 hypothetical protein SMF913_26666 [Streptomyces malaysiensis]